MYLTPEQHRQCAEMQADADRLQQITFITYENGTRIYFLPKRYQDANDKHRIKLTTGGHE